MLYCSPAVRRTFGSPPQLLQALVVVGIHALAGCASEPVVSPTRSAATDVVVTPESTGPDLQAVGRFAVTVEAVGPFRVGSPVQVVFSARALLDTKDAELRILAPEAAAARQSAWGEGFRSPINVDLAPEADWHVALAAGASVTRRLVLSFPAPGYYRLLGSAFKRSGEPPIQGGRFVQDVAHSEIWLLVDSTGGRATAGFQPELLPKGAVRAPGPFRMIVSNLRSGEVQTPLNAKVASTLSGCHSSGVLCGQLFYLNRDNARYEGVYGALVYGDYIDNQYGTHDGSFSYSTEKDGYYEIRCYGGSAESYQGTASAQGGSVTVLPSNLADLSGWAGDGCESSGNDIYAANSTVARVFNNMMSTADQSRALFGISMPSISVSLTNDDSLGASRYSGGHIYINQQAIPSQVWGPWGVFTAAHEYGHAVQDKAMGGIPSVSCPSPHYIDRPEGLGCAFVEGFADYHAVATRGDSTGYYGYIEADAYLGSNPDGSVVEGSVASTFLDLTDAANEAWDHIQVPGSYVKNLMSTCSVYGYQASPWPGGNRWYRANGMDDIVYCMEQQVDAASRGYFVNNPFPPTAQQSSAGNPGWNLTDLRSLWHVNMFHQ